MDKTLYTLKLGGNDVTLKFNIGTLRKLKDLMGKDPLTALLSVDTYEALDFAEKVVHAGILSNNPAADVGKVKDWFEELKAEDATNIINAFARAYTPEATPEGGKDTQQG